MPYSVNSQGQTVWVDDPAQANAVTKDSAAGGRFVAPTVDPTNPLDALGQRDPYAMGGGMDTIMGAPPPGKHWMSDGTLADDDALTKFGDWMGSKKGIATIFTAGTLAPVVAGALSGAGATQVAPEFGSDLVGTGGSSLVSTAQPFSWQSFLTKAGIGAAKGALNGGGVKGMVKGALTGGLSGGPGFNPRDVVINNLNDAPGGNSMDLSSLLGDVTASDPGMGGSSGTPWWQKILGMGGGSGNGDSGGETNGSSPSVWSQIWNGIKGNVGRTVGTAGDVASGIEKGRTESRNSENNWNLVNDRTRLQGMQDYENALENRAALELKQKQFQQDYENNAAKNAMRGALGMNMQDVTLGGVPSDVPVVSFNGGARPSALGPQGRAAAALLNEKAMKELQNGVAYTDLPAIEKFASSVYKSGNALDDVLGGIGAVGKAKDAWDTRGATQENADWIKKLHDLVIKQQQPQSPARPVATPNGVIMVDANGNPVQPDEVNPSDAGVVYGTDKPLPKPPAPGDPGYFGG